MCSIRQRATSGLFLTEPFLQTAHLAGVSKKRLVKMDLPVHFCLFAHYKYIYNAFNLRLSYCPFAPQNEQQLMSFGFNKKKKKKFQTMTFREYVKLQNLKMR